MDDILSETVTAKNAVNNYRAILTILDKHNVKAKMSKFDFGRKVSYDGLRLSDEGMLPSKKIVDNILNICQP